MPVTFGTTLQADKHEQKSLSELPPADRTLSADEAGERCLALEQEGQKLSDEIGTCSTNLLLCRSDMEAQKTLEHKAKHLLDLVTNLDFEKHEDLDLELYSIETDDFDLGNRIKSLGEKIKSCDGRSRKLYQHVLAAHNKLLTLTNAGELVQHEQEISDSIKGASVDQAIRSSASWAADIEERMRTTQDILNGMTAEFAASVDELIVLIDMTIKVLKTAAHSKTVPVGAPYVGGKTVLKYKDSSIAGGAETKRHVIENFLDKLIIDARSPGPGAALLAEVLLGIAGGALNIQFLKMVIDPHEQYVPINKLTNSGGEAVAMAMFIYLVTAQIRAESRYKQKNAASGPLFLDNPFAKATNPSIWKAQRALAESMGTQLILATALPDYNTLDQFTRIIRLRRHGQNNRSGRWHLEVSDYEFVN